MFGSLTEKFKNLLTNLVGQKQISEDNIASAVKDVRLALLDADVNYSVVSSFVKKVKERAIGESVIKAVSPGDQFIKIVHDELISLMGIDLVPLNIDRPFSVILLCGLQGSGKTTTAAKLAYHLQKKHAPKKILVAACDLARPAAIEQLKVLCASINVPVFTPPEEKDPVCVAKKALDLAKKEQFDVLIIDTAGRLHIDTDLMNELEEIKKVTNPTEVLFVANSTTGQDAVTTALHFDQKISITGTILTMLDGTSRAGAAISIREITKKPLKFEGIGEKIADLQPFNPQSMADRILGMGDVVNLVRRAKEEFDDVEAEKLEKKIKKAAITYDDYLKHMKTFKRMGPLKGLLQMLPGSFQIPDLEKSQADFNQIEAIISSMTPQERMEEVELIPSRRWRIAKGSGVTVDDVNRLVKGFKRMKEMMKSFSKKSSFDPNMLKNFKDGFSKSNRNNGR
jgi:signal recognition particle subunit SRP54